MAMPAASWRDPADAQARPQCQRLRGQGRAASTRRPRPRVGAVDGRRPLASQQPGDVGARAAGHDGTLRVPGHLECRDTCSCAAWRRAATSASVTGSWWMCAAASRAEPTGTMPTTGGPPGCATVTSVEPPPMSSHGERGRDATAGDAEQGQQPLGHAVDDHDRRDPWPHATPLGELGRVGGLPERLGAQEDARSRRPASRAWVDIADDGRAGAPAAAPAPSATRGDPRPVRCPPGG